MECPLCSFPARSFLRADRREYRHCPRCELIYVPPRYFISREKEVERYRSHNNTLANEGYVRMFEEKIEVIRKVCPGVRTILDYGCGPGPVLQTLLSRRGYAADAFDPNFFPDGQQRQEYDLILSTETFEHFKEPVQDLNRLFPLLPRGGYLAVMTQFYPRPGGILRPEEFGAWYYKRDPTHIVFYCHETFSWIARNWGLHIIYIDEKDFVVLSSIS